MPPLNVNIKVSVYSLKSPLSSADFTMYAPGIGTLSYTVSSPLRRNQLAHFTAAIANHYNLAFSFHQVPIRGQRQHDMRGSLRLTQHLYT